MIIYPDSPAVLAHDRLAGCMRVVPFTQVEVLDQFGDPIPRVCAVDTDFGTVRVWNGTTGTYYWARYPGLSLVVKPDVAREKARPPA